MITVCDAARDACPYLPTAALTAHWGLEDPAGVSGDHAAQLQAFRAARDVLRDAIRDFLTALDADRPDALRQALDAGRARIARHSTTITTDSH
ncbi:MAG: hypothetical protein IT355_15800 [Gemmatimonadaceae bacterium]|nr:hypothetical protein [Gemmatimonadaceae bacterium]